MASRVPGEVTAYIPHSISWNSVASGSKNFADLLLDLFSFRHGTALPLSHSGTDAGTGGRPSEGVTVQ